MKVLRPTRRLMPNRPRIPTEDIQKRFEINAAVLRTNRPNKLRHGGNKLPHSKVLQHLAIRRGRTISRRAKLFWGQDMNVVYPEPISLAISRYGFYEEGLTRMVLASLKPGMTFIDVGAHIGYYSMLASWLVGQSGQVHSFEPTPSTFEVLRSNAGHLANVVLNQAAVASESGTASVNDYGPAHSGYNSVFQARMPQSQLGRFKSTKVDAPAISIDEYASRNGLSPDFVKLDAESAEYDILKRMEETIQRDKPTISVEVGDMDIDGVLPCRDLVTYLIGKGYDAFEFRLGGISEHSLRERYDYENILFLPAK